MDKFVNIWYNHGYLIAKLMRLCTLEVKSAIIKKKIKQTIKNMCLMRYTDKFIYSSIRMFVHKKMISNMKPKYNESYSNLRLLERAENRLSDLVKLLGTNIPTSVLDIGCAEGSIISAIAKQYNISSKQVFGVDVLDYDIGSGYTFLKTFANEPLPFRNNSISLITSFMCLHHVDNQELMISECYRILEPGGLIVIREHDVNNEGIRDLIDIMHGLYSLVWSNPPENPNFVYDVLPKYHSLENWTHLFEKNNFQLVTHWELHNISNAFYSVYQKSLDSNRTII